MPRKYKTNKCEHCEKIKVIAAKGLCRACYQRQQKTGSLEYRRKGIRHVCMIDNCDSYAVSNSLCDKHRKRLARHGHTDSTRPNDWGKRENHPLYSAWANLRRFRGVQLCDRWHKDFWLFVKECPPAPKSKALLRPIDDDAVIDAENAHWVECQGMSSDEQKEYTKHWVRLDRKQNPDKYKNTHLMRQYGITLDDYKAMATAQGGLCKICRNPETALNHRTGMPRELAVDHCHSSGDVRGLLCTRCNTGLGVFRDDISILEKAIVYLTGT